MKNRITELFGIQYPIIQGGMVWCSGWRLASAVSNSGGLGLLGAGSMHPETLLHHIAMMRQATDKPWGVNVPLMYPEIDRLMQLIISEGVKIVFTSAGSPAKYTKMLHDAGVTVAHVVSSSRFAVKCEEAGAEGVQIGTLFALSKESSASEEYKQRCAGLPEGGTMLCLKKLAPTRLVRNTLYEAVAQAEARGAGADELRAIIGHAASKRGIFLGDTDNGELEIGQAASAVREIKSVDEIMASLVAGYEAEKQRIMLT